MNERNEGRRRMLAERGHFRLLDGDGCGRLLVLEIGPISIRLERAALLQLHDVVGAAVDRLRRERDAAVFELFGDGRTGTHG